MALTVQSALSQIEHSLGGSLSGQLDAIGLLNEVGQYLVSMHDWMWLDRPPVSLDFRAEIDVSGTVTWHDGQHHLTKASSGIFANYSWLDGDSIVITAGSGTPYGRFPVIGRVTGSDDAIHIGWTYDPAGGPTHTVTDFAAKVKTDSIALPSDFGNIINIQPTEGLVNSFNLTDTGFINQLRTNEVAVGNFRYWGAITRGHNYSHTGQESAGQGAWRLEIYPTPTVTKYNALTMYYRAGWRTITEDMAFIPIPDYCETLFRQLMRSFARGYEEDDVGSLHLRLAEIEKSPIFLHAKQRDGNIQNTLGQMAGGAAAQQSRNYNEYLKTTVIGPN